MPYHTLQIPRTARYCQYGEPGPHIRQFWLVCHGYAQLAGEFIENFRLLDPATTLVIAPEGFNYFYKKGFSGPVGANWMTRWRREEEIADYANYLNLLVASMQAKLAPNVRTVLLGFSQGTATVCRYMLAFRPRFDDLVLWGGLPPEDLDYAAHRDYLATKNLYLLYGTDDPFLTDDRLAELREIEDRGGIDFEERRFAGGHEIPPEALRSLLRLLN
jgi:predicted esterase